MSDNQDVDKQPRWSSGAASQQSGNYRLRLRRDGLEIDVGGPDRLWVLEQFRALVDAAPGAPAEGPAEAVVDARSAGEPGTKAPSLAELVSVVEPSGGLEHLLVVGYFLERFSRLRGGFRRRDVAEAFRAIHYHHSNPGVPMATARRRGLIMDGEEHEKVVLTDSGERWVTERLGS